MDATHPAVLTLVLEPTPHLRRVADLPTMLDSIAHALGQLVPGAHVGIAIANSAGALETLAGTHPLAFVLDHLQHDLDEGPSVTVVREESTAIIDDARSDHRWPRFMAGAIDLGLCSYLGVSITVDDRAVGVVSVYSTIPYQLDAVRLSHAKLFAAQAGVAVRHVEREADLPKAPQASAAPHPRPVGPRSATVCRRERGRAVRLGLAPVPAAVQKVAARLVRAIQRGRPQAPRW